MDQRSSSMDFPDGIFGSERTLISFSRIKQRPRDVLPHSRSALQ